MSYQLQLFPSQQPAIGFTPLRTFAPAKRLPRPASGPIHIGDILPEVVANILARRDRQRLHKWKRGPND